MIGKPLEAFDEIGSGFGTKLGRSEVGSRLGNVVGEGLGVSLGAVLGSGLGVSLGTVLGSELT